MCPANRDDSEKPMKPADRGAAARLPADFSKVLVVGKSSINRVVVSKIVEKSGLKPISEPPEAAEKALAGLVPGAIILDGGPDDRDCDRLLSGIDALRRASGKTRPAVILLSTRNGTPDSLGLSSVVDAVVAKPITPERLQPVIDRLVGRG
ncbi:MAG: response regulator [Mesorhizobium sp.]|nr:response regulator [Mesorhizobium sp. M1A.F.Ca.IN.022.06.1.1]RUV40852.1 response regulator [Mesorhizobium sp. M1A.T.Ca.IN.004.03.1.1]RWG19912.1 MAG: response regulator [Mesorhizobium sp.]TGQ19406.1 response regulator [Mesorhizobium sp. M00.F.Ca.ET.217.01.1.1]TGV89109.1 response regulator [Mesorhizobium sp. M00.F.Ca.ET.158.01.1.1]